MSQSSKTNYAFTEWVAGSWLSGIGNDYYTPINLRSSGSRFSKTSPIAVYSGISMSQWYGYDMTRSVSLPFTASLYYHVSDYCYPSSMIVVDAGTTNATLSLNISGSADYPYHDRVFVYYGKPWSASGGPTGSATIITSSNYGVDINWNFKYNYTYDSNKGRFIYFVLYRDNCFAP